MKNCENGGLHKPPKNTDTWYGSAIDYIEGESKSAVVSILNLLPMSPDAPFTVALFKHYVEGSKTKINLSDLGETPKTWRDFIVKETGGREGKYNINPYNSGIFDLTYSIGHFDVTVTKISATQNRYEISDFYVFGNKIKNDIHQKGRHGFPVPLENLSDDVLSIINDILPEETYCNPGGFLERFELRRVQSKITLFIPQKILAKIGKPYEVIGSFIQ